MNGSFLGFGPIHWGLGLLVWLLIIIGVVALYFAIRKQLKHDGTPGMQPKSALQILQERYVRGEIDDDEYAEKKKQLDK